MMNVDKSIQDALYIELGLGNFAFLQFLTYNDVIGNLAQHKY